ncbi:MAG TPA: shikimate dehydrogenase [Bacteroidia bacterium]|nr:shikimate dehydrogenase [Bacteroidia bacterium]HNU33118.1 shikimate dehydrogenase [Bacteroidia bacterium]
MADFGLIGKSLSHSFSQKYFQEKFLLEGLDHAYHVFDINSLEKLIDIIDTHPSLRGLNVTVPYKQEIIKYLNETDEVVKELGAVNTIKIISSGRKPFLKGLNTDVIGFKKSLLPFLLKTKVNKALVLGNGGSAQAVKYVLKKLDIDFIFVTRNNHNAKNSYSTTITYNQLSQQIMENVQLIVNCTPLGKFPDVESFPPIPYQFIKEGTIAFDLNYNPASTVFLQKAIAQKCLDSNGLEMLYSQAEASWQIWNS